MKQDMEARVATLTNMLDSEREHRRNARILRPWICSIFASFGIFGGISCMFVGLICVVIHGVISHDKIFDSAGTVLLVVAIPMILIGSVFLDKIERS